MPSERIPDILDGTVRIFLKTYLLILGVTRNICRYTGARAESPEIISYGADGKPGGRYFDTDISTWALFVPVQETPSEARVRHVRTLTFIGICAAFVGFLFLSRLSIEPAPEIRTEH